LGGHGTANAEAYELVLKARYFFLKQTEEGYLEARRLYLLAIEKDPKFADAHLGVAITYGAMVVEGFEPPAEGQARYEEEVRKARSSRVGRRTGSRARREARRRSPRRRPRRTTRTRRLRWRAHGSTSSTRSRRKDTSRPSTSRACRPRWGTGKKPSPTSKRPS